MPKNALKHFIVTVAPAVLMLVGVILISSGFFNALSSTSTISINGDVVVTYPRVLVGSAMAVFGGVLTVFSYLWLHGKISVGKLNALLK